MPQPTSNKPQQPAPASGANSADWATKQRDALIAGMNAYHAEPDKCDAIGRAVDDEAVRRLHGHGTPPAKG